MRHDEIVLESAGFGKRILVSTIPNWGCGRIVDGVSLRFEGDAEGVISLAALKKLIAILEAQNESQEDL